MKQKVALVLSGGGARGIAHIGAIQELENHGYEITSVAGTSMGALVGGVYAAGELPLFKEWISILDKFMFLSLMDFSFGIDGILKGKKVLKELQNLVPDINIEDCRIPYAAVATDLLTRKEVVFEKGRLYDGIRASISLPPLFQPYKLNDMVLIDGGTVNQLPLNRVKRTPGDILVAIDVSANIPAPKSEKSGITTNTPTQKLPLIGKIQELRMNPIGKNKEEINYINLLMESVIIMFQRISELMIDIYKPDILVQMSIDSFNVLEFYEAGKIIKAGAEATREVLEEYKNKLSST